MLSPSDLRRRLLRESASQLAEMAKVLFIAYYFPPVGGAGVQRAQKFVQYLPTEGFVPVVITGPVCAEDRWTPQDRTLMNAIPAHVAIHRGEGPVPDSSGGLKRRMETWLSLPGPFSKWWVRSAMDAASRVAKGCDLIFATMSPFESGEVAQRLSKRFGIPWVADLRDPWALDEMQVYPSLLHRKLEQARMGRLLSSAALIVMNTPEAVVALRQAFPNLCNKEVLSITNGFDPEDFASAVPARTDSKFRIVHSGYLHTDSGLRLRSHRLHHLLGGVESGVDILTRSHTVLLEAIDLWISRRPEVTENIELVFAGQTSKEDREFASSSRAASLVRFAGYLSHGESVELLRTADLLFLPMHNLPPGKRSRVVPGKTYEYMASGRPILAAVPDGDARDFLHNTRSALMCRPDDASAMMEILDRVYKSWKRRDSIVDFDANYISRFERQSLTHTLAQAFSGVLERETKPGYAHAESPTV